MSEPVTVLTEFTPNPNSLKFNTNREFLANGTAFFASADKAFNSPLAKKLFDLGNIAEVFIGREFVTITRAPDTKSWAKIISGATEVIRAQLESGEPSVFQSSETEVPAAQDDEVVRRIIEVLDERIRPAVARDGGDIIFDSYQDGVVRLHLQGACSSCPSSTMTLKVGVESMLKELVPEVREVIQA